MEEITHPLFCQGSLNNPQGPQFEKQASLTFNFYFTRGPAVKTADGAPFVMAVSSNL